MTTTTTDHRTSVTDRLASAVRRISPAWFGVIALGLVAVYYTQTQPQLQLYLLNTVLFAAIGAIALNLLMGTAGQPSIGNAAFLAIGAFAGMFLLRTGLFPFPLDVIGAAVLAAAVGLVFGLPALRLNGLHLILATLSAHFLVLFVVNRYQRDTVGEAGFLIVPEFADQGLHNAYKVWAWVLFGVVSAVILLTARLTRERSGRAWRLIRDNELVAPTFGIRPTRYKLVAFALSSGMIGMQGALFMHFTGSVNADTFTLFLAIQYLAMILIGGLDSTFGAVVGAAIVTWLPTKVPDFVAPFIDEASAITKGPQISTIVYGVLIIFFITASPNGIAGWFRTTGAALLRRRSRSVAAATSNEDDPVVLRRPATAPSSHTSVPVVE